MLFKFFCAISVVSFSITNVCAQHLLRHILDSQLQGPVPYATIKILNKPKGEIANEKGAFFLDPELGDTILITSVGYYPKRILGSQLSEIIYLEQKTGYLSVVGIKTATKSRTLVLGNGADSLNSTYHCPNEQLGKTCWPFGTTNLKEEFAEKIMLPDSQAAYKLNTIIVPILKFGCWGPLLLRIYRVGSFGLPGEEIFIKRIEVDKKMVKRNKLFVDVRNENIFLRNERAFFISLGWPPKTESDDCLTTLLLIKSTKTNSYSRSLTSDHYLWQPEWRLLNAYKEPILRSTAYAVELDVLK